MIFCVHDKRKVWGLVSRLLPVKIGVGNNEEWRIFVANLALVNRHFCHSSPYFIVNLACYSEFEKQMANNEYPKTSWKINPFVIAFLSV